MDKPTIYRKPIDVLLMFKVIFLLRYYGLGDHQIQYQTIDRTSFRQFLGLHTLAEIPDEKTVCACRDRLGKADKKTKSIEKCHTTDASVHNSNVIEPLIEEQDKRQALWPDARYAGKEDVVGKCGPIPVICE